MGVVSRGQTFLLLCGAGSILLIGLLVTWVTAAGAYSHNLAEADEIIRMYTRNSDGPLVDVTDSFQVILIAGIICSTGAILGCCGAFSKNKVCLSIFTLMSISFGVFFVLSGLFLFSMAQILGPIVQREIQYTCRDDVFHGIIKELQCDLPIPPTFEAYSLTSESPLMNSPQITKRHLASSAASSASCGAMCKQRVERLRRTSHPCRLVHYMCTSVASTVVGSGQCLLESGGAPTRTWSGTDPSGLMTRKDCKHFCAADIACTAYAFGKTTKKTTTTKCVAVSPNMPGSPSRRSRKNGLYDDNSEVPNSDMILKKSTLVWARHDAVPTNGEEPKYEPITKANGDVDFTCFFKATHRVVDKLLGHARNAGILSMILGALLIICFNCAFFVLMKVSTRTTKHPPWYSQLCCLPSLFPSSSTNNESTMFMELETDEDTTSLTHTSREGSEAEDEGLRM